MPPEAHDNGQRGRLSHRSAASQPHGTRGSCSTSNIQLTSHLSSHHASSLLDRFPYNPDCSLNKNYHVRRITHRRQYRNNPPANMDAPSSNPLLSTQKSSQLQAVLHPLVLLTISDYITRHTLREQKGPIIGALLGQQNGREITIEHAFECHVKEAPEVDGGYLVDVDKFGRRLEQSAPNPPSKFCRMLC